LNYLSPKNTEKSAFTLIEVMIALSVLILVVLSITTLTMYNVQTNDRNIDNLQAQYLAEQGLEAVREIRDSNFLQNYYWLSDSEELWGANLSQMGTSGSYYTVALNQAIDSEHGPWILQKVDIKQDDLTVKNTNFKRYLFVKPVLDKYGDSQNYEEIYVESVVKYNFRGQEQTVKLFSQFMNWH